MFRSPLLRNKVHRLFSLHLKTYNMIEQGNYNEANIIQREIDNTLMTPQEQYSYDDLVRKYEAEMNTNEIATSTKNEDS
jgi:hypothetical protein